MLAPLISPALTGVPTAPTAAPGVNTTQLATTAFVFAQAALLAPLISPALTGTPTAPTAAQGTSSTQLATTAFVTAQAFSTVLPAQLGNAGKVLNTDGTSAYWAPGVKMLRDARTANTALSASDFFKLIDLSGTFAQTFSASASLVSGWFCYIYNSGTGLITLTPNGAELIDGAATRILYPGERRLMQCDGLTIRTVEGGTIVSRRPLFAAGNGAMNAGSNLERVENVLTYPNTTYGNYSIASNGTNVVVGNSSNIYSSPDGRVWTARTGALGQGMIASDGSGFLAVYNGGGTLGTFYSADGITWSAATALPGGPSGYTSGINTIAALGAGRYLVVSATTGSMYLTTNSGTAWTTVTYPGSIPTCFGVCSGLFVGSANNTNYYTSATGATSSWTARTFPGTTNGTNFRQDFDKSLIAWGSDGTAWRSTDAINWTQITLTLPATGGFLTVNGMVMCGAATSLGFSILHNSKWVYRTTQFPLTGPVVKHLGLFLMSINSLTAIALIDPTATDAATGLFD